MAQYDVDLRDYWRIIKKKRFIIIGMVFLVGLCSYGFARLKEPPPLYKAEAAIKIEQSTNLVSLLTGGFWNQGESLVTHAYLLTSYPVLKAISKMLNWIPEDIADEEIRKTDKYSNKLKYLKSIITTEQEKGANVINIQVVSGDKEEAADVADKLTIVYQEYNKAEKKRKTDETKKFIEKQIELTSGNLKRAEKDLQDFKEGYSLVSLDGQTLNMLRRMNTLETEFDNINLKQKELISQLQLLKKMEGEYPAELVDSLITVDNNSPVYQLKIKLNDLMLKRQTLLIHLTEKHPQVNETDAQIKAVVNETQKELRAHLNTLKIRSGILQKKKNQLRSEFGTLPEKAIRMSRFEREVKLQADLFSQLKAKYQETLIQESGLIEEVTIVKPATKPSEPFNIPSPATIVFTGIVMGIIIGIVFAFGAELFDTSMGTIEDVEESLQVPVLGVIPFMEKDEKELLEKGVAGNGKMTDLIIHYDPKSLAAEAFRSLRTNLQFMSLEKKGKVFLITSTFVQEGKTLNVINLALSTAQAGENVLLVEADLRKPLVYKNFGLSREPGLTDYILGNYSWKEVVNNISDFMLGDLEIDDVMKTPGLDNLHVVTAGTKPPNPSEILGSSKFSDFLKEAAREYDFVFIDAPPVLPVADATEIAPLVDGVILVYTVGKIARGVLKRAKSTLDNIDANVLGVILNNVKPEVGPDYFKFHTQYYYGSDKEKSSVGNGKVSNLFEKIKHVMRLRKTLLYGAVIAAILLLIIGVLWNNFA